MKSTPFDEQHTLHELKHYLPAQSPLKDFIHHNTLHAFQHLDFYTALREASAIFGYRVWLPLAEYRQLYHTGRISDAVLDRAIVQRKGSAQLNIWREKLLSYPYDTTIYPRIGRLRSVWKSVCYIDFDLLVHPLLFRIVCSYLDQGISIWAFPTTDLGFLDSIRTLERDTFSSFFKTQRPKDLLLNGDCDLKNLLHIVVGDESLFEQYLFDQQFSHQGWSGIVSVVEDQPQTLVDTKKIALRDLIILELLLEIDALDNKFGVNWAPLSRCLKAPVPQLFEPVEETEVNAALSIWQDAFEWSFYDQVLAGIRAVSEIPHAQEGEQATFQAMFCIDDRECSLRRYIEQLDVHCKTYGTPGFFGVEFYYQPENSKSYTKLCPAPVMPQYLIKEGGGSSKLGTSIHFTKHTHSMLGGWLISQTIGYWSALRLALNIFKPSMSAATSSSFRHMDQFSQLTIENKGETERENGLQIGFTVPEMAIRVENLLRSIGLVQDFAPIVYVIGHGSTSVNNTHYAGYDCGACSGRPGSVNARVICYMANHTEVRQHLRKNGIDIPDATQFVGALHDTSRDEIAFYDEQALSSANAQSHEQHRAVFDKALDSNAKERSRRFDSIDTHLPAEAIHEKVRERSVSLFEPRPELNHATNALCIVGRRELSQDLFLDRRSFMNSYDYHVDPTGKYLGNILNAVAPVCGGINLEYYFSRVDNHKLGAGTKLAHNVMGLFGVANGTEGDLRPGLPSQMIEVHDPVRLLVIVEHYPEVVLETVQRSAATYEWFLNKWIHLVAVHPETKAQWLFSDGAFAVYQPLQASVETISDLDQLLETNQENFPVYLLN